MRKRRVKDIVIQPELVAVCGLYCGACPSYRKGKCPGCRENKKATWCATRTCALEKGLLGCADCALYADQGTQCKKMNNAISKIFGLLFNSNRAECLRRIRAVGRESFAREMAALGRPSLPRKAGRKP